LVLRKNVYKEMRSITNASQVAKIAAALEALHTAPTISDVPNCKKMQGNTPNAYRIRVGSYRIAFYLAPDNTADVAHILHRKDIYAVFP
jgi:mRNA interferase RelE/StbE